MNDTNTIDDLIKDAIAELKERLQDDFYQDEGDLIAEISDSSVPIYNYDIMEVAMSDMDLVLTEPEIGPAFDGTSTPLNIIAANIYEAIQNALYEELDDIKAEIEEERELDEDDDDDEE